MIVMHALITKTTYTSILTSHERNYLFYIYLFYIQTKYEKCYDQEPEPTLVPDWKFGHQIHLRIHLQRFDIQKWMINTD